MTNKKEYNEELELEIIHKTGELHGMIMILDNIINDRIDLRIKTKYINMYSYLNKIITSEKSGEIISKMAERSLIEKRKKNGEN